jgi:hypothetical protein
MDVNIDDPGPGPRDIGTRIVHKWEPVQPGYFRQQAVRVVAGPGLGGDNTGIDIPSSGGAPRGHIHRQMTFNHEMNVVIEARTGQYLQAFSYR